VVRRGEQDEPVPRAAAGAVRVAGRQRAVRHLPLGLAVRVARPQPRRPRAQPLRLGVWPQLLGRAVRPGRARPLQRRPQPRPRRPPR